jgi:transposase-like protein
VPPRLIKNSELTNRQLNQLIGYFALEAPARRAAKVMNINRHSAERVYQVIRRCLARECELHSPLGGEVECDESYFGGRRKGPLWGYAKTKLKSYYGVSRERFYFYLKGMEFRFNHRKAANLAALIKKIVRKHQAVLD